MAKLLTGLDGPARIIRPTTTRVFAQRMLAGSREIARAMPYAFYTPTAIDLLLALYVAEDDARYLATTDLDLPGTMSPGVTLRWVAALANAGLVERQGDLMALSEDGYALVTRIIESIYAAQRALD